MPNPPTGYPRNVPVLCLDTCSVLDILRDPGAKNVRENHHQAAVDLLRAAEEGRLRIVAADLVRTEYADRVDSIQQQASAAISRLLEAIRKLDTIVNLHGSDGRTDPRHWLGHVNRCRRVSDRWVQIAGPAQQTDAIFARGARRVAESRAPSRKGNEAAKDCIIIEAYLEHVRGNRLAGLTAPVVFVSSNVNDYTDRPGSGLAADLVADFAALEMRYAPNMAAAKAFLNL